MTTTPKEPLEDPQVVPSGDPSTQPDQNPAGPNEPGGPDAPPDWEPQPGPDGR